MTFETTDGINIDNEMEILEAVNWIICSYMMENYGECIAKLDSLLLKVEENEKFYKTARLTAIMIANNNHYIAKKCLFTLLQRAWENVQGE